MREEISLGAEELDSSLSSLYEHGEPVSYFCT